MTPMILRTIVALRRDNLRFVHEGETEISVSEDGRLFVYDYAMRKDDPEFSGLVFVAEAGEWTIAYHSRAAV